MLIGKILWNGFEVFGVFYNIVVKFDVDIVVLFESLF